MLLKNELSKNSDNCTKEIFFDAILALASEDRKFHVHRIYDDVKYVICSRLSFMSRLIYVHETNSKILEPLTGDNYASFYVWYGGYEEMGLAVVQGTKEEWQYITGPLTTPAVTPAEERSALAEVVSRFEKIVGPKAGTQNDIGGVEGNLFLRNRYYDDENDLEVRLFGTERMRGQQNCANEVATLRDFVDTIMQHELLVYHRLEGQGSLWTRDRKHVAVRLLEKTRDGTIDWVVDSWYGNNGEKPLIMKVDDWNDYYTQKFKDPKK